MTPERWQQVKQVLDVAVTLGSEERTSYLTIACDDDADLLGEVESLLRSHDIAGRSFLETPASDLKAPLDTPADAPPSRLGQRIGAYDIVGVLGRGGMGEVYRAVRADGQFTKNVALKLVRTGLDTRFIVDRFRTERQILAGLDHPNIARLLDGGSTEDGIPYLVMELVDGVPIDAYCDAGGVSVNERLQLFRHVCAAIQYAHQRLVIHRDIKPTNILVTSDGTPKLLDFGIAKLLDVATDAEATLARPMTLEYASPEQVLGGPITTSTDVYSLGVVLYRLLTGQSPYGAQTRSPHELARAIAEAEPERPSAAAARNVVPAQGRKRLDGDLDNILLMALRKEPQRRYASVEQLSEDVRRDLENRPVVARTDSWRYRSRKFVRRHRAGVVSSAVAVVVLVAGAVAIVQSARAARRQAEIARAERARAVARFDDVKELSNSLIFEFHDAIENLPGATPARKLLLDRAVEYLDRLAKDSGGDPDLQRELAWGYQRLAVVQGSPAESNLGDAEAAEASNRKATALFESVARARPADVIDQLNVAMGHRLISFAGIASGTGGKDLDQAMAITERLLKIDPSNLKVKSERSIEYQNLALMEDVGGDRVHALESFERDLALKHELMQANYPNIARAAGMATTQVGDALMRLGRLKDALRTDLAAMRLYDSAGTDLIVKREMAIARMKLGDVQLMTGDSPAAEASFRLARATIEVMANADPQNRMLQLDLVGIDYEDGRALATNGQYERAIALLDQSLRRFETLQTRIRPAGDTPHDQAAILIWLGDVYAARQNPRMALQHYNAAVSLFDSSQGQPLDYDSRCEFATGVTRVGDILVKMNRLRDASVAFERALAIGSPLTSPENGDIASLYVVASAFAGSGDVASALARRETSKRAQSARWLDARNWFRKSIDVSQRISDLSRITPLGFLASGLENVQGRLSESEARLHALGDARY